MHVIMSVSKEFTQHMVLSVNVRAISGPVHCTSGPQPTPHPTVHPGAARYPVTMVCHEEAL